MRKSDKHKFMKIELSPIGIIHSKYSSPEGVPIQSAFSYPETAEVEIFPEYVEGLSDLEGFSHIFLLYWFHKTLKIRLRCTPFLDTEPRGVFATRAPCRPNPIGFSVVELLKIEDNILKTGSVDIVDKTPLLDIKPYIPDFDIRKKTRTGWYKKASSNKTAQADSRFVIKE